MKKPDIRIEEFDYLLLDEKIAKFPLDQRDDSKFLIFNNQKITDGQFREIAEILPTNSILFFNNTKVIRARLEFFKTTGARIEIFCLEPYFPIDYAQNMAQNQSVQWKCIIGNAKKWKEGELFKIIESESGETQITLNIINKGQDYYIVEFSWDNTLLSFADIIELCGNTPIPPYLNRESQTIDETRYQTVYSKEKGSVAAPTAGLHFTPDVIAQIKNQNIDIKEITLHVGAGTFKPVKTETIAEHEMHKERFYITKEVIDSLLKPYNNTIAVGTTTVRTLESIYWLGVKLLVKNQIEEINQWDAYNLPQNYSKSEALNALLNHMQTHHTEEIISDTKIMIAPGYHFKIVDILITNFHQPQSTLLLLISAFVGQENWKKIYHHALNNNYRFLSYGDSSILFKQNLK